MLKTEEELRQLLKDILKQEENECVEFKRAENNFDIDKLGKYFSAISNEATLKNKQYGWIIFGIDDKTHEYTNTKYRYDNNFNDVKKQISDNTTDNVSFIEIYPFEIEGNRVIMFQIPATSGTSMKWKGFAYGRAGESLKPLESHKEEQIRATANYDWSRRIIEDATIKNLDEEAIKLAREKYKEKHQGKDIANEIDNLSDIDFLNKAKLTLNGKITRATMLLLGKNDDDYLLDDCVPKITWKLYDDINVIDYEHFGIPFLINVDKVKNKIRNLRYRYMVNRYSLFPNEVDKYDNYILRELLHNCIVHQDYRLKGTINVMEFKDKLIITNEGSFIPQRIENVLKDGFSSPYYRNQFLANAMVNLNMIDTVGSGIRRIYDIQKKKYFPMPDYDLEDYNRVKVILYGKIIDENYSKILFEQTELDIDKVMLLDRVQKKYQITKEQSDYLKKDNLIEGRYPNIYVSSIIAELTDQKQEYIAQKGLDNQYYKDYIVEYIKKFKSATRQEINDLIKPKLSSVLNGEQKDNKVRYLLRVLKEEGIIKNIGTDKTSKWVIKE